MPEKASDRKKKAKPPTPRARAKSPAPALSTTKEIAVDGGVYVTATELSILVLDQKQAGAKASGPFSGFEEAREAAVVALVEAIESAERRLVALKHAADLDQLRSVGGALS